MLTSETVTIHEITRVTPLSDSTKSTNEVCLPLTFFETYWYKHPPIRFLFFYQLTESASTPSFFNSYIVPKLKQSLSLALLHYRPFAGNIKWPSGASKPLVLYTPNDGVSVTIAESNEYNFHIVASNIMHKSNELHPLAPQLISSDEKSEIISFQITLFPYQGFCIGVTSLHTLLDGQTASMFLRSWAYQCKQGNMKNVSLPPNLTPSFDRIVIKDPNGLDMLFVNQWLAISGEDQDSKKRNMRIPQYFGVVPNHKVRATFDFSSEDIKKLKEKTLSRFGTTTKQLHLSTFVLTVAYTITCMIKARGEEDGLVVILIPIDCRTRLDPPLPITFSGSCVMYTSSSAQAKNFTDDGLSFATNMISDMVIKVKKGPVLEAVKKDVSIFVPPPNGTRAILVDGSPKLNFYETDFGLGKLKKVELVSVDLGEDVFIAESRDGSGGTEVSLVLKIHEMEKFATFFQDGLRC